MKKILVFLLSLTIVFTPTMLWAGAAEKWEILENTYDTAKKTIHLETRKISTDAANSGRYVVDVPVNPSDLGKTVKSMLWAGLAVGAVTGLVEGIGWVIDYGSKVIKKEVPDPNNSEKLYKDYNGLLHTSLKSLADSISGPNGSSYAKVMPDGVSIGGYRKSDDGFVGYWGSVVNNPNYDPTKKQYEYMDDSQLGNEIMGQGQNSVPDPTAIISAYNPNNPLVGEPAPAASNDALDSANPQPQTPPKGETAPKPNLDTDGDGVPDDYSASAPTAGEEFTWPAACDWFPAACDFFGVQKQFNKDFKDNQQKQLDQDLSFFDRVREWLDWTKEQPELPDETLDIQEPQEFDTSVFSKDRFSVSRQCPVAQTHTINLSGQSVNFSFDLTPICQVLDFARPALVACSYLYACYIVIGAARNG